MKDKWLDISVELGSDLPTWPGSPGVSVVLRESIKAGAAANVTQLSMDVHSGTHIDAPLHFVEGGESVEEIGLGPLIGPALVVDLGPAKEISASVLDAALIPDHTERVLLRTTNSSQPNMYRQPFDENYAALTLDGAEWFAAKGPRLIGVDYLSIQRYSEPPDVHRALLSVGITILEGLCLAEALAGSYDLVCLPTRLVGVEGAPARAILMPTQALH